MRPRSLLRIGGRRKLSAPAWPGPGLPAAPPSNRLLRPRSLWRVGHENVLSDSVGRVATRSGDDDYPVVVLATANVLVGTFPGTRFNPVPSRTLWCIFASRLHFWTLAFSRIAAPTAILAGGVPLLRGQS